MAPSVHVLGTAQDGGFPHVGCICPSCVAARIEPQNRRLVSSIGLLGDTNQTLLVDATPDFGDQIADLALAAGRSVPGVDGIILTHAHFGHYLGLAYLGREGLSADNVPVYCTSSMQRFVRENRPWSHLPSRHEIDLRKIQPGEPTIFDGAEIHVFLTPHRGEDTDTLGFEIRGPKRSLVYISDADTFPQPLVDRVREADVAIVDGTFFNRDELPYRDIMRVKHPFVEESVRLFAGAKGTIFFTHLNHTNALLLPEDAPELPDGFAVAREGMVFEL